MHSGTRRVRVGCEFVHVASHQTPTQYSVEPLADQVPRLLAEKWSTAPAIESESYRDIFGNRGRRLRLPAGESLTRYDAIYEIADEIDPRPESARQVDPLEVPPEYLIYTLASRYCPSDMMRAHAWKLFGGKPADINRVQDVCDYVHNHLTFKYGSSEPHTTALDVYVNGYGVCRDYAHLFVTFCRALNLPTRYVFGYPPDIDVPPDGHPMDFAAFTEVYLEGGWVTFDPRNNSRRKGRILVSRGRDAGDVALTTTYGSPWLKRMTVWADEYTDDALPVELA